MSSKSLSQIFKILPQAGDINTFVICGVFFSRYVQLKGSFSGKKYISSEIWDTVEKLLKINVAKFKGKFHCWQKLELCKVIHSAKLH